MKNRAPRRPPAMRRGHLSLRGNLGTALITAMLVLAISVGAVVGMTSRQQIDVRRTANQIQSEQAFQYALGIESWATGVLADDAKHGSVDHLGEGWASPLPPRAVEGGRVAGSVRDVQARFNLNNLVLGGDDSELYRARFRRLLGLLNVDQQTAQGIVDWLDADLEAEFPNGAEDEFYLRRTPDYRSANRPMADVSELRLVRGVDAEAYRRMAPFISTLPTSAPVNVNTAPAAILMCIAEGIGKSDAESLIRHREETPFKNVAGFLTHDALAGRSVSAEGLATGTKYFEVHSEVQMERARVQLLSLLSRQGGAVRLVHRLQGSHLDG